MAIPSRVFCLLSLLMPNLPLRADSISPVAPAATLLWIEPLAAELLRERQQRMGDPRHAPPTFPGTTYLAAALWLDCVLG